MYNVISGMRRSGTSMLMYALRSGGMPCVGLKYSIANGPPSDLSLKKNPNGYWEMGKFTITEGLHTNAKYLGDKGDIIKVMSECLHMSEPGLIDKCVMIFRNPHKSVHSLFKNNVIEYPDIFILNELINVCDSLEFLKANNKPVKIVIYEEILKEPFNVMSEVCEFLGAGRPYDVAECINKKLNRTKFKKYDGIELFEQLYEQALTKDPDNIINLKTTLLPKIEQIMQQYD